MDIIEILLLCWGVVTAALICMLIYRATLSTHEEDQLFLDSAGDSMASEQRAIVARIESLTRPIVGLMILSGVLLLATAGVWFWHNYQNF
jgi:hypothetical protein